MASRQSAKFLSLLLRRPTACRFSAPRHLHPTPLGLLPEPLKFPGAGTSSVPRLQWTWNALISSLSTFRTDHSAALGRAEDARTSGGTELAIDIPLTEGGTTYEIALRGSQGFSDEELQVDGERAMLEQDGGDFERTHESIEPVSQGWVDEELHVQGKRLPLEQDGVFEEEVEDQEKQRGREAIVRRQKAKTPGHETKIEMLPRVLLVGRPNVGKSALFNRLTKRREALVYNTPDGHVTRDIREGVAKLADLRFKIYDTAGLETESAPESVLVRTAGITSALLNRCHLALFLLDGRAGLQPLDPEVGKWLRKQASRIPVVLVLNKAEGIHDDASGMLLATLGEAHSLGFGDPVAISAETGEGLTDLYEKLKPLLEQAASQISETDLDIDGDCEEFDSAGNDNIPLQLAIAGRPNVGKSTLLNSLLRQERVLTGPEPGLTRDSVRVKFEYEGRTFYLVDTAGWMQRVQAKQGPAALSAMHARRSLMRAHIVALILDGEEIAKSKKSMLHSEAALARWVTEEGRGLVVVVNKMDLLKGKEQAELRSKVMKAVPEEIQTILPQVVGIPIVFVSALEGKGRAAVMKKVFESYERWNARLPTARLNNWLQKVLNRHPRRGEGGHGARVRYITQVKARPPTFVAFITGSGELQETDLRFLSSALREDFNLGGIPIRIVPRHSRRGARKMEGFSSKAKGNASSFPSKRHSNTLPSM